MSIVLLGSTSGSITLQEPAISGNTVLSLPATTGTVLTSASPSSDLPSSINGPAFSAVRTGSNQTITANTFTKVQLNTEDFDTNNCFDSSTNYRFTPTTAGYYQINGAINAESSTGTTSRCLASIYKNGTELKRGSDISIGAGGAFISVVSSLIYFNGTTDYVELYAFISASTAIVGGSGTVTYLNGSMVRAA